MSDIQLKVLGCNGGFGKNHETTALLLNENILIDCGTGVGNMEINDLNKIDHVFITHCHLDHIVSLPFLLDLVGVKRATPIQVYASHVTIKAIREHIMNDLIWPDFTQIPSQIAPSVIFNDLAQQPVWNIKGCKITPIPVPHVVDACAYVIESSSGALAFSGDTGFSENLIHSLNEFSKLKHLIIETSFPDEEQYLAELSQHLCPQLLTKMLAKLKGRPAIHISHLKPGSSRKILEQIESQTRRPVKLLKNNQNIIF